jgi:HK97 family phage prohead protease
MDHIHCSAEIKEIKESNDVGSFEGVASMYGNIDLGGDIVEPGAFKEFMYTPDRKIRILDGHNTRAAIGKGEVIDSHIGLVIKGQLNLRVSRARDVYELMKDGIINGLSIGFDVLAGGSKIREDGVRLLQGLKLWEVSATPFPMNPQTLISSVKQATAHCTNIREFERLLRDIGFSQSQAKALASHGWKALPGQRDVDESAGGEPSVLLDFLKGVKPL